jgi:small subunit ribosomal protein S8
MAQSDPIADMLTRMRNAVRVGKDYVDIPSSKMKVAIAKILKEEGYVKYFKLIQDKRQGILRVFFKYDAEKQCAITGLQRVSKPGLRRYVRADEIPQVLGGMGICVVSTSKGLMTGAQARRQSFGGELICNVW